MDELIAGFVARLEGLDTVEDAEQTAKDLIEWYNTREEDLDQEDLDRLFTLVESGQFRAWDCPSCGERCYLGEPDDWGDFQGVRTVDYVSYPVRSRRTHDQCDHCRMTMVKLPSGYVGSRSGF